MLTLLTNGRSLKIPQSHFPCTGKLTGFVDTITLLLIDEVLECVEIVDLLHYLKKSGFENFEITFT